MKYPKHKESPILTNKNIIAIDDFAVQRLPPLSADMANLMAERDRLTTQVLRRTPPAPPHGWITGSFIYSHPPDYAGRPTLGYTTAQWRELFQELKELGMDTVILQAAAWVDFSECYYPSALFPDFRSWDVFGPMFEAVAAEKLALFLGVVGILYTADELGITTGDPNRAVAAARRELAAYDEFRRRYGQAFQGYYLAPETTFPAQPVEFHQRCWNRFVERVTQEVKSRTPDLPILASPATTYTPGREAEVSDYWLKLYENCAIDILAPQDSIGCVNNLEFLAGGLTIWKTVSAAIGAAFWSNCESFAITDYNGPLISIEPAEFRRLAVQMDTAAELGAKKLITWKAVSFMVRHGDRLARRLRADYLAGRSFSGSGNAGSN